MKVVYVSGKYRDERGPWYVQKNIDQAADIAVQLWQLGFSVICPHKNTAFFEGPIDDPVIIAGDCELVRRSDALVVCPNWRTSQGTYIEWKTAWDANKPIFYIEKDMELLRRWANNDYDIERHLKIQRAVDSIEVLSDVSFYKGLACSQDIRNSVG